MAASLATTLSDEYGTQQNRFVGVAHISDPRWPTYTIVSGTFPPTAPVVG